ncbi:hypothetical protein [Streptomyces longisporoflavus]|uniref:DUF1127 domain-containing protein n=1 Tax=Streptomyces longisporoflavus TaxID=28044 RepID=A0ABW7R3G2_9ACTN
MPAHGPVHGGDNLAGLPRRLERWLRQQINHYSRLVPLQQQLLDRLGLSAREVERFAAARRRARAGERLLRSGATRQIRPKPAPRYET